MSHPFFVPLMLVLGALQADESTEAKAKNARLEAMRKGASEYRLFEGSDGTEELSLRKEPVFRWSNPVQGSPDGLVFLWTSGGRPAAILGIFPEAVASDAEAKPPTYAYELQSLSLGPLVARRGDDIVWNPTAAGISLVRVPDAQRPAAGAAQRLTQMKGLARRFTSSFLPFVAQDEQERIQLRLLPQPLYRYELADDKGGVQDGALFAFAQGTDPQTLLLLESRQAGEDYAWHYALARFASGGLDAQLDDKPVWSAAKHDFRPDPNRHYLLFKRQ